MFWGCVLKEGQPYKVQHALEDGSYPVLHVSNAVLKSGSKGDERTTVNVSMGKELKNLSIAVLQANRSEVQSLDLYLNISQNITISVQGKGEVHMSGYFEPNNSLDDQMYGQEEFDDEEGESEEEEDIMPVSVKKAIEKASDVQGFKKGGDLDKQLKAASKNTIKNSMEMESDDEDSEDDMDESGEDIDGIDLEAEEDDDEEIDSDMEDLSSEEEAIMKKLEALKKNKPAPKAAPVEEDSDDVSDDDSDDSENDLQALLKKKSAPSPPKVQKTVEAPKQQQK